MTIFLLISFLISAIPADHDFKMSVCEINYIAVKESFEVKFYIFQDDLKETLYGNPQAPALATDSVSNYILEKVKLSLSGQPVQLVFSEIKEKEDQVQVVFHSNKIAIPSNPKLLVSNLLLIEKFRKQINMVYVTLPGRTKLTQILNTGKTVGKFD